MPNSHTWKRSQRLASRILNDRELLARQLRQSYSKLAELTRTGGKLSPLADQVELLPAMVWTYATKECLGPSYHSVSLAISALNYLTASTSVLDLLTGRDDVEEVFGYVCKTIAPDLRDFERWKYERYRKA